MIITNFHHWGLAEWLDEKAHEDSIDAITANIYRDEDEDIYYIDFLDEAGGCLETFCYMREDEIKDDINEANKQFNFQIQII